jgi:DNA-binding response OmpR family regulator
MNVSRSGDQVWEVGLVVAHGGERLAHDCRIALQLDAEHSRPRCTEICSGDLEWPERVAVAIVCGETGAACVEAVERIRSTFSGGIIAFCERLVVPRWRLLALGADDCTEAPLDRLDVSWRVRRLLWRVQSPGPFMEPTVRVDASTHSVRIGRSVVRFRAMDFKLIAYLVAHRDTWVAFETLADEVFHASNSSMNSVVRVHVCEIRRRLGRMSDCLISQQGWGYQFTVDPQKREHLAKERFERNRSGPESEEALRQRCGTEVGRRQSLRTPS